jgi:hypothetical protein
VTIAGANFGATQGTSTVTFGAAAGVTVTSWSATSIVVNVPASVAAGSYPVTVTVGTQTSNAVNYTVTSVTPSVPVISAISPTSGVVGSAVTITGSNFGATQGTSTVQFGMTVATATAWSDTSITATVPAGLIPGPYYNGNPAGVYDVTVTTDAGTSNAVQYTVLATPAITAKVGAAAGGVAVGQRVTVRGAIKPGLNVAEVVKLTVQKWRPALRKWVTVRTLWTHKITTTYSKAYKPAARGSFRVRASIAKMVSAPAWHTAAHSSWRAYRVR